MSSSATSAPIEAGRPAFVNRNVGCAGFVGAELNLGTTYAVSR